MFYLIFIIPLALWYFYELSADVIDFFFITAMTLKGHNYIMMYECRPRD